MWRTTGDRSLLRQGARDLSGFCGFQQKSPMPRPAATSETSGWSSTIIKANGHNSPEVLIRHLLEGTCSETGQEFFHALVRSVAMAMNVAGVWVTEYLPDRKVLRSLAFWMNDHYVDHY